MLGLLKHHKKLKWPFKTMGKIATSNKTQFTTEKIQLVNQYTH